MKLWLQAVIASYHVTGDAHLLSLTDISDISHDDFEWIIHETAAI